MFKTILLILCASLFGVAFCQSLRGQENPSLPFSDEQMKNMMNSQGRADRVAHQQRAIQANPTSLEVLVRLVERKDWKALGATSEQELELEALADSYKMELKEIRSSVGNDNAKLEAEYRMRIQKAKKLVEILLPHQLEFFVVPNLANNEASVLRLLSDTSLGEIVGLSEQEKEKISQDTEKFRAKLAEELEDLRKEYRELIKSSLTETQMKELEELLGDPLKIHLKYADLDRLAKNLEHPKEEQSVDRNSK
jgi:hypothetical protein